MSPRWKPTPALHATLAIHAGAAVGCLIEPAIWPWALGALVANELLALHSRRRLRQLATPGTYG